MGEVKKISRVKLVSFFELLHALLLLLESRVAEPIRGDPDPEKNRTRVRIRASRKNRIRI